MKIIKDDEQRRRFGALRQLIMYMLRYKLIFACVVVVVIASNLLALVIPQLTGVIVDALVPGNVDFDVVVSNVINIALIGLASYVLSVLQNVLMLRAAQHVVVDLRHDVFQKLSRLPVSFFDGNTKGNILAILVSDIDNISDTVSSDAITLLTGMVILVGAITMMLRISPLLTLVFAVTVPIMAVVAYFVKNRARVLFREKKNWFGRLCGYAEEMITAQKTIKVYGIEDFNEQKFDDMSEKLRAAGSKAEFASSTMMPQMNFINNLNYIGICAFGALLAVSGGISIGNISTFTLYAKKFSAPIVDTANIVNMLQATLAACDRVFSILGAESEPEQPLLPAASNSSTFPAPQDIRGEIRFEHVNFSYVKDKQVLNDISFTVKPGERIAIVGATGSGKTTIVSLLMRFYECTDGRITID
ncbi:MAG: ABC transporter ATP-binding protein, partial [Christensenellales bacterium]